MRKIEDSFRKHVVLSGTLSKKTNHKPSQDISYGFIYFYSITFYRTFKQFYTIIGDLSTKYESQYNSLTTSVCKWLEDRLTVFYFAKPLK